MASRKKSVKDDSEIPISKKQKQAKKALERYHRLSEDEKKALNKKRSLQQKRLRQKKKELAELESILRESDDVIDPPQYPKNQQSNIQIPNDDPIIQKQKEQNARKALRARIRYHNMTSEEKKNYNQKRSLNFKKSREQEQSLLTKPLSEVNSHDIDQIEQIMSKKARIARNARLAYQKMTPEERKIYNQKRKKYYIPKSKSRSQQSSSTNSESADSN